MPIIGYRDLEDAVERANGTHYGLGGSVWGNDPERAAAVAERMEAGMTWVNTHTATSFDQPFAGIKWSGIGVENGRWALEGFTDLQVITAPAVGRHLGRRAFTAGRARGAVGWAGSRCYWPRSSGR